MWYLRSCESYTTRDSPENTETLYWAMEQDFPAHCYTTRDSPENTETVGAAVGAVGGHCYTTRDSPENTETRDIQRLHY